MQTPYPLGKLPAEHLARLLARYTPSDPRVVLGPGIGRDAAVISFGDRYLIAKTDPITFATDEIGWYAVHVNANDVACTGATARWFLATLLLPEGHAPPSLVDDIFDQIASACDELGVALVGGHTEITHGLDRPIVVGCMLGEVTPEKLVRPDRRARTTSGRGLCLGPIFCSEVFRLLEQPRDLVSGKSDGVGLGDQVPVTKGDDGGGGGTRSARPHRGRAGNRTVGAG